MAWKKRVSEFSVSLALLYGPAHCDNRQTAKTYLESGVPHKCPTD